MPDKPSGTPIELIREDWDYILYDYGQDNWFLSVTCGRAAVFDVSFFLTPAEKKRFKETGEADDITRLAGQVRFSPESFKEREERSRIRLTEIRQGF